MTSRCTDSSWDSGLRVVGAATNDDDRPNDHGPPGRGVVQRSEHAQCPPHAWLALAKPVLEQILDLGSGARAAEELEEMGKEGVGVGDGQCALRVATVVQSRGAQAGQHRAVKRRVVVGVHGVQGEAYQRCLDHLAVGECGVQVGGLEVGEAVPEREVRRYGLLRLQGGDPPDSLDRVHRFAAQQQLPRQGGRVQLPDGEAHLASSPSGHPGKVFAGGLSSANARNPGGWLRMWWNGTTSATSIPSFHVPHGNAIGGCSAPMAQNPRTFQLSQSIVSLRTSTSQLRAKPTHCRSAIWCSSGPRRSADWPPRLCARTVAHASTFANQSRRLRAWSYRR